MAESQSGRSCKSESESYDNSQAERTCLVEVGFLCHKQRNTGAIPHAIAIAGPNFESVLADWDTVVDRRERIVGLQPDRIHIVHPILETHLLWPGQGNGIKTKLDVMRAGR